MCLLFLTSLSAGAFWVLPASLRFHITETYLLRAEGDATVSLGILLPKSSPYQDVDNATVSWPGSASWETVESVDVLKLWAEVEARNDVEAVVEYDAVLHQNKLNWESQVQDFQLQPQSHIESDCPDIMRRASEISDGAARVDAYQIFKFTSEYILWSEAECGCEETSAMDAYQARTSSCSGFSNLMVALCRASGIPAQRMSGIILPDLVPFLPAQGEAGVYPGIAHGWVEFYTDQGWETADPTFASGVWKWFQFGRNDGLHLSFGEAEAEGRSYYDMALWAAEHGELIGHQFSAIKFVAAADPADVSVTPVISVKKVWDGRIFNTLIVWLLTIIPTTLLSRHWLERYQRRTTQVGHRYQRDSHSQYPQGKQRSANTSQSGVHPLEDTNASLSRTTVGERFPYD